MKKATVFKCVIWVLFIPINYGFLYGGVRQMQVRDWPLTQGSRPSAYREARWFAVLFSLPGPFSLGAVVFTQACAGIPGWHVTDWPNLQIKE